MTWLCRLLGVGGLALLGVTWKLWTPQDVFPRVPLFAWAPPRWWDWASLAALIAGLTGLCLPVRWRRLSAAAVAGGFAVQFLADQHRLQPWAWQFFILAVVIALADDRLVFRGWFSLVLMIYLWSALSKTDDAFFSQFAAILGKAWLTPVGVIGLKWTPLGYQFIHRLAHDLAILPVVIETTVLILAIFVRTRRWAFRLSALMHLFLIMLLGPWGMGHQPGVLVWNLFFIAQNALLFSDRSTMLASCDRWICDRPLAGRWPGVRRWTTEVLLTFVMFWPALEPWGYCDAWLGWAVYVPRFHRVEVWIDRTSRERLPAATQTYCETYRGLVDMSSGWNRFIEVKTGAMSLGTLGAPNYPNHRLQVSFALDWQQRYDIDKMDLQLFQRKDRFQPEFKFDSTLSTPAEIEAYARTFRVNALPESVLRRRAEERAR
ncbi:MAG TPA: hypothetical protein VM165_08940 [Planctomycetaceae bacterium]|nr:hypothetical protein [Planctomycetaceae bacterium]